MACREALRTGEYSERTIIFLIVSAILGVDEGYCYSVCISILEFPSLRIYNIS